MPTPRISVVVPTRDRPDGLRRLLAALAAQNLPAEDFEVIVVDDGSSPPANPAGAWPEPEQARLRVLRRPHAGGPAAARNAGRRAARAPFIAFTDDDCRPDPDWLAALLERAGPDVIVQGRTLPDPGAQGGPFSHTQSINGPDLLYETCNIAYPRALLERLSGFDERYRHPCGEDVDLGWRAVKQAGARLEFAGDALVHHAVHNPGLRDQLRATVRWTDAVRVVASHPELRPILRARIFWRPTHPPTLALLGGLALSATRLTPWPALGGAALYVGHYARRQRRGGPLALLRRLPRHLAVDACEVGTMLVGSVRHRTLML